MARQRTRPELAQTELVEELPAACASEAAAAEFLERRRWGDCPGCPHCGSANVYQMRDRKTGERSKRFLWKCRETKGTPEQRCGKMFTVRTNTVYAESLIPLRKWCRALWETATAKNGCSALELSRRLQVTYKTALFMLHRIRHAMADGEATPPKLTGTIEADEMYWGGRAR
ncbi:MAG: transposase [Phycisphaerales bacterium]